MSASAGSPVRLTLSESATPGEPASWIGPLLALGTRAARWLGRQPTRQLVIALSVPSRDFAAVLVGSGWVMVSDPAMLAPPLETLRMLEPETPIRFVTRHYIRTGRFLKLGESAGEPWLRATGGFGEQRVKDILALAVLSDADDPVRSDRPSTGDVGRMAHLDAQWDARLAAPAADLAIVGTLKWLEADFEVYIGRDGSGIESVPVRNLLLPQHGQQATWYTRLYPSARLADQLPLPDSLRAVILDGSGAIQYLAEIETPLVVCILDRSVIDETAAEIVVQIRNSRGEPVSVTNDLGWRPPAAVEALAFTVPL